MLTKATDPKQRYFQHFRDVADLARRSTDVCKPDTIQKQNS